MVARDDALIPPAFRLERLRAYAPAEAPLLAGRAVDPGAGQDEDEEEEETDEAVEVRVCRGVETRRASRGAARRAAAAGVVGGGGADEEEPAHAGAPRRLRHGAEVPRRAGEDETDLAGENSRSEGDEIDGDEESDAERRRRRRGRRGGRRRVRRESGAEAGFEGSARRLSIRSRFCRRPRSQESEPTLVEARASWPAEVGAVAIETASLPALAGDGRPAAKASLRRARASRAGGTVAEAGYEAPHPGRRAKRRRRVGKPARVAAHRRGRARAFPTPARRNGELEAASAEPEQQHKPEPPPGGNRDRKAGKPASRLVAAADPVLGQPEALALPSPHFQHQVNHAG